MPREKADTGKLHKAREPFASAAGAHAKPTLHCSMSRVKDIKVKGGWDASHSSVRTMYDEAMLAADLAASPAAAAPGSPVHSKAKRALDLLVAGGLLLALLPVLLMVAALIRLDSPGPVLFRQRRGGAFGQAFVVYKFRTMRVLEDGETVRQATRDDDRITRVGTVLRRMSIDELPQLINVLRGEMSLVGPRPHALAHDREFQSVLPDYGRRFAVKPGVTGLAQVRGFRGETREISQIRKRLDADLEYIATWSLWTDIRVLLATLKVPLDRRAY